MTSLDRYQIIDRLGQGGMATVYHAHDPRFGRDVALKVLPREFLHDVTFRERFEREARIIAQLEHSAIVPVHDYGESEGQPFLVMRYMTGGSLADRIRSQGALSVEEALPVLVRVAAALDAAHQWGIIHRDVKPANILFDQYEEAYLSDFGIVKLSEATAQLTGSGIIGTPAYMAPEMANPDGLTHLVDIYALGVTLYEMLSGSLPFRAQTPMGLMMAHATKPVPDIRIARPDLSEEVSLILEWALAKPPAERCQTAGGLAEEFLRASTARSLEPAPILHTGSPNSIADDPDTVLDDHLLRRQPDFDETVRELRVDTSRAFDLSDDDAAVGGDPGKTQYQQDIHHQPDLLRPVSDELTASRGASFRTNARIGGLPVWIWVGIGTLLVVVLVVTASGIFNPPRASVQQTSTSSSITVSVSPKVAVASSSTSLPDSPTVSTRTPVVNTIEPTGIEIQASIQTLFGTVEINGSPISDETAHDLAPGTDVTTFDDGAALLSLTDDVSIEVHPGTTIVIDRAESVGGVLHVELSQAMGVTNHHLEAPQDGTTYDYVVHIPAGDVRADSTEFWVGQVDGDWLLQPVVGILDLMGTVVEEGTCYAVSGVSCDANDTFKALTQMETPAATQEPIVVAPTSAPAVVSTLPVPSPTVGEPVCPSEFKTRDQDTQLECDAPRIWSGPGCHWDASADRCTNQPDCGVDCFSLCQETYGTVITHAYCSGTDAHGGGYCACYFYIEK